MQIQRLRGGAGGPGRPIADESGQVYHLHELVRHLAQEEVHMPRRLRVVILLLGIALIGPTQIATYAQDKGDRVAGTVQLINKETKTIVVSSEANNKQTQVMWDDNTKVTKDNKAASIDDVQNGVRVICTGKTNDKGQLHAGRIDVRPAS
jgi:hypothetical protein